MHTIVPDSSTLLELETGLLLEHVFSSHFAVAVPDLVYATDLANSNGAYLQRLGLSVSPLSSAEMATAQTDYNRHHGVSLSECFTLSLARRDSHVLVSTDEKLVEVAILADGNGKGLLWLLDELVAWRPELMTTAFDGLEAIVAHHRSRLPRLEVARRLRDWRSV